MKPEELRIGNYVKLFQEIGDNILQEMIIEFLTPVSVNGFLIQEVRPIPLTEEWLVKFGAEIIKDEVANCAIFDRTSLRLAYNDYDWHCSLGDDDTGILFRMIKYVHQLQNLYFALTGKELEFK